jgi:hypothetical protein
MYYTDKAMAIIWLSVKLTRFCCRVESKMNKRLIRTIPIPQRDGATFIGTLNKQQVQILQMQRTLIPFGVTPEVFIEKRADQLFLTDEERERIGSPDFSDEAETEMYVWALTDICVWLESQLDGKQRYRTLIEEYQKALLNATTRYTALSGHAPILIKAINMVMTIARAKKLLKGDVS